MNINTPILDSIDSIEKLRNLPINNLITLSHELRDKTIEVVSKTGGHLGAGLGVIELTIALHHVFNTPQDKIIWGCWTPNLIRIKF